jgi:predicted RecB family endonuclease
MTAQLTTIDPEIDRDRYGRPMVVPPGGGKKVAYTRATTYVDALEDKYALQKWQQRMVILGLVDRPDLLLSAAAHSDDKTKLNRIAEDAIEAAKAGAAATVGTAIHALTHRIDRGETIGPVPGEYQRDLDAYTAATAPLTVLHAERFSVLDDLRIGGTPDRIVEFEGERYIADIKTGSVDFGAGKIAMQLAVYAHAQFYDVATGAREPLPGVNGQRGIVIHLPAGTGTCRLLWVDIAAGWEAVQVATQVREWRARKNLMSELAAVAAPADTVLSAIADADTPEALVAIWAAHQGAWTDEHTAAASARKSQLTHAA